MGNCVSAVKGDKGLHLVSDPPVGCQRAVVGDLCAQQFASHRQPDSHGRPSMTDTVRDDFSQQQESIVADGFIPPVAHEFAQSTSSLRGTLRGRSQRKCRMGHVMSLPWPGRR